jgi:dTMP kinase
VVALKNIKAIHARSGGTPLGERLRAILLDLKQNDVSLKTEAMMSMASRAELVEKVVWRRSKKGVVVSRIASCSPTSLSGHAAASIPKNSGASALLRRAASNPDLTFVLDLPVEMALARRGRNADRMEARDRVFRNGVRRFPP